MLNVSPIILFSEIAQQLRTKEGREKYYCFSQLFEKQQTKATS